MAWEWPIRQGAPTVPLQHRGAAVDGELRLAVENDEHLFRRVVEVMPHASTGHDFAPVHEVEIDVHSGRGNQKFAGHVAGTIVGTAASVLAGVGVTDPGRQGSLRPQRRNG